MTEKKKTMAEHEVKATDAASDATVRQRANDAIVAQTPYISALEKVRLQWVSTSKSFLWNRWRSTRTTRSTPRSTTLCETTLTRTV